MDYGGHGSTFHSNLVLTKTSRGSCLGLGPFLKGTPHLLGTARVDGIAGR